MKNLVIAAASAFVLASASSAFAATELENLRTYCAPDIERLCAGTPIDDIKECLQAHKMEVSVGCAEALEKLKD